jgi:DNA-binding NarL/FixJ family response regulator
MEKPASFLVCPGGDGSAPVPASAGARIRLLLADDHAILRKSLASMLSLEPDLEVVGEAEDGQQALTMARSLQPQVILLDISMPRLDGLAATRRLVSEMPHIRVIACSMHAHDEKAAALRDAGAAAYVDKMTSLGELANVIRRCCSGLTELPQVADTGIRTEVLD